MAYLTTGLDLKLDALALAGEPQDGTSQYDGDIYEWLTQVQRVILSGGTFGQALLQPEDWYWARAWPRGVIQLQQPLNQAQTITATFTAGSTSVPVTPIFTTAQDFSGYRILEPSVPARHLVRNNDMGQLVLEQPWTGPTMVTDGWLAYPDTYELPEDFIRGTSPLFLYSFPSAIPATPTIDVIDPTDLERFYPQTFPWGGNASATITGSGMPVLAARVTQTRLRFSHFLNTPQSPFPAQVEFEYIRRPEVIAEGTVPVIPIEHRRILSYGVSYLIWDDKSDSVAQARWNQFTEQFRAMRNEHQRTMRKMSSRWGVVQPPRSAGNRAIRLTETGLPIYIW